MIFWKHAGNQIASLLRKIISKQQLYPSNVRIYIRQSFDMWLFNHLPIGCNMYTLPALVLNWSVNGALYCHKYYISNSFTHRSERTNRPSLKHKFTSFKLSDSQNLSYNTVYRQVLLLNKDTVYLLQCKASFTYVPTYPCLNQTRQTNTRAAIRHTSNKCSTGRVCYFLKIMVNLGKKKRARCFFSINVRRKFFTSN